MGQQWPAMGSGALNIGPCLHPFEGGHHYPTHLEPGILALGSITMNKASEGDGIPVELFQILKDDAVKVLHSICQQIWKTESQGRGSLLGCHLWGRTESDMTEAT